MTLPAYSQFKMNPSLESKQIVNVRPQNSEGGKAVLVVQWIKLAVSAFMYEGQIKS